MKFNATKKRETSGASDFRKKVNIVGIYNDSLGNTEKKIREWNIYTPI